MKSLGLISAPLKNKTVFITGGGAGIGFATAKLFAKMDVQIRAKAKHLSHTCLVVKGPVN